MKKNIPTLSPQELFEAVNNSTNLDELVSLFIKNCYDVGVCESYGDAICVFDSKYPSQYQEYCTAVEEMTGVLTLENEDEEIRNWLNKNQTMLLAK